MIDGSLIKSITAVQAWSWRGHPPPEARVVTRNGALGVPQVQAGTSVGRMRCSFSTTVAPVGRPRRSEAVAMVKETTPPHSSAWTPPGRERSTTG
jgi:hypothetical protein